MNLFSRLSFFQAPQDMTDSPKRFFKKRGMRSYFAVRMMR